jgi:hypothetical protein
VQRAACSWLQRSMVAPSQLHRRSTLQYRCNIPPNTVGQSHFTLRARGACCVVLRHLLPLLVMPSVLSLTFRM